jgi:outer membrane protein TolC
MRSFLSVYIFLLANLIFQCPGFTQSLLDFDLQKDNISSRLPSLAVLIDSAIANNPDMEFRKLDLLSARCNLKESRQLWTKNIGIQSDIRYGTFDSYSTDLTGNTGLIAGTGHVETRFSYSAYLKIPVFEIVNHRNQNKLAKAKLNQAESMIVAQHNEIRKQVILHYNDLILKQRLLSIKTKNLETVKVNMQMVEKEFLNGIIPLAEYARISGGVSSSEADVENARTDFLDAYMMLEEITGVKLNIINSLTGTYEDN